MRTAPTRSLLALLGRLERKFLPPSAWKGDKLTLWRERVLLAICSIAASFGFLALIPSIILAWMEGRTVVLVIDCLAYALVWVILLSRNLALAVRAWMVCFLLFSLGAGLTFLLGPYGAGYIWLFGFSVLAGGLMGLGAAVWALFMNVLALGAVALGIWGGSLEWAAAIPNVMEKWLVMLGNFIIINAMVTLTMALMLSGLREALAREQKTSASLRQSEARFRALAENAPDVIFTLDMDGRLDYINPALTDVLGFAPADVLGLSPMEFVGPGSERGFSSTLEGILGRGQVVRDERLTILDKKGSRRSFTLSAAPRLGASGHIMGMVGLLKDITETEMLTRQLMHSQKMEAVGTLAGGIAHDFNNILGAISGYAELGLEAGRAGRPVRNEIDRVLQAVDRARDLVKRLLTFSRKAEPEARPMDLNLEIEQAVVLLERTIPKMVRLVVQPAPDLRLVNGDPVQVEQVLMNLVNNAVDAMPLGGVVTIATANVDLDGEQAGEREGAGTGPHVELRISDTGTGMDAETLEHIFEPFFTRKAPGKGTGLGLATVSGMVASHGGHILCHSTPGAGATFLVYFPALLEEGDRERVALPQAETFPPGSGAILVVDDETDLLDVAGEILRRNGFSVLTAASGEEALDIHARMAGGIRLVVLDINMPGMGGFQCLQKLVAAEPGLRVLVASGYSRLADSRRCLEAGAAGYLAKPFRRVDLLREIWNILGPAAQA